MADLKDILKSSGISPDSQTCDHFTYFYNQVLEFNDRLALISKANPQSELLLQIEDSLKAWEKLSLSSGINILDIGSGAGFPGMIFKLRQPEINLYSLDSNPRKIAFQERVAENLGLTFCHFLPMSLIEYKPSIKFDIVTAKAFGKFKQVFTFSQRYLSENGRLVLFLSADQKLPESLFERYTLRNIEELTYDLTNRPDSMSLKIIEFNS